MRIVPSASIAGLLGLLTLSLLPGCATTSGSGGTDQLAEEERIADPGVRDLATVDVSVPTSRSGPAMRAELSARNATGMARGALMDILFDFDRATLRPDALPLLESDARHLQDDGVRHILLEGRGDEVGTAAYNLVLGERRAKAVRAYLQQLGLQATLQVTSYGKDRPLCFDHGDVCRQKNRSVHFVRKE